MLIPTIAIKAADSVCGQVYDNLSDALASNILEDTGFEIAIDGIYELAAILLRLRVAYVIIAVTIPLINRNDSMMVLLASSVTIIMATIEIDP